MCPLFARDLPDGLLVIFVEGEKPRAFRNLGQSCWINSAVQALLSPPLFKSMLAKVWRSMPRDVREQLHRINHTPRRYGSIAEAVSPLLSHEVRLAATLCSAHTPPLTEVVCPYLFTDAFYESTQADAAEFIARVLHPSQSPCLGDALRGRMRTFLTCTRSTCKHVRPTAGEDFTSLPLPLLNADGLCVKSVQEALDGYMPDVTVTLADGCGLCGHSVEFKKSHEIARFPRVLLLNLNRWTGHGIDEAIVHSIEANRSLRFRNQSYDLCATVCHLGPAPDSGHYIAVARHPTSHGVWWLYDDSRRVIATDAQVSSLCSYRGWGPMQCYVLLYERRRRFGDPLAR